VEGISEVNLTGHAYAGFWRRVAAYLIDTLLLGVVQALIALTVYALAPDDLRAQANFAPVVILVGWAYFALMESSPAQATVGKMALGIYVTDRHGDPIDFRRATVRYWAKVISTLTLMAGYLMTAFTPGKRALHDYLAGTLVLRRAAVPLAQPPPDPAIGIGEHWDGSRWTAVLGPLVDPAPVRQPPRIAAPAGPTLIIEQRYGRPTAPARSSEAGVLVDRVAEPTVAPPGTEPGVFIDEASAAVAPPSTAPESAAQVDEIVDAAAPPAVEPEEVAAEPAAAAPPSVETEELVAEPVTVAGAPAVSAEPEAPVDETVAAIAPPSITPEPEVLAPEPPAAPVAAASTSEPAVLVEPRPARRVVPVAINAAVARSRDIAATALGPFAPTDLLIPIALIGWAIAIAGVKLQAVNDYGLIPALPPAFFVAFLLLVVSIGIALSRPRPSGARLLVNLLALVLMLHGVLPLILADPQYAYVYKHFGVVDYIATHGSVDERIDIYQNWPTFFALSAWFDKVAGVQSPIVYAGWSPAFINLAALLSINASLRTLTTSVQVRWLALFIFVIGNWVGQDYFSPQAFAFVLSQAVLACLLTWFKPTAVAPWVARIERGLRIALRSAPEKVSLQVRASLGPRRRTALLVAIFGIFTVITISHQLSPYMVIAASGMLMLVRALRPRWIVLGFAAITGAYLLLRFDFLRTHGDLILSLNPFQNAQNPDATPNDGVFGRVLTAYSARALSLVVWLLALAGAFRRIRAGWSVAVPMALIGSAFLIIFGLEYGGEAIYRVYLFSLPWAALLAAFALAPRQGWTKLASVRAGVLLVVMFGLFAQAYFGLTEVNLIRPAEVAASHYFNEHARPGSVLVLAAPNFPERSTGAYADFVVTSGAFDPQLVRDPHFKNRFFDAGALPEIAVIVRSFSPHGYVAITTGMKVYAHVFKLLPDGSLDSLDRALASSNQWTLFFRNQDAVIYELSGSG
jgi:uncharacterized RDD family membrane protein YckC